MLPNCTEAGGIMSQNLPDHHNGSLWFHTLDELSPPETPSSLPAHVDVAIVGGGYTGLWTAYYLKKGNPDLDVAVFEAVTTGFGASGRNGGWCMGLAWGIEPMLANARLRERGVQLLRAMHDTVDEVGRVCQAENIDCHYHKGGTLTVATRSFKTQGMQDRVNAFHELGFTDDDYRWLPAEEARRRLNCDSNHGAVYTPHCAAIHPARLVRGLADVVRRRGVKIFENTPVTEIAERRIDTPHGSVSADVTLRATEGYSDSIAGQKRQLMPLYSMMVATEPLPEPVWQDIGLKHRETFGDGRRVVIYGQRTQDDRLAFGGRAGYYFGSKRKAVIDEQDPTLDRVEQSLRDLFPQLNDHQITHRWGGLMGVPRHWRPSVSYDPTSGFGAAGGYTGEGVAASNLAGRILADLVLGEDSAVTRLAWVNDTARRWEPEPLRWLGARAIEFFGERADRSEFKSDRPSKLWGNLFNRFVG